MRDNCYNHTETVDQRLASFGFTPELPLYVAADWADVDRDREQEVRGERRSALAACCLAFVGSKRGRGCSRRSSRCTWRTWTGTGSRGWGWGSGVGCVADAVRDVGK